jgi:hypothetical protein
MESNVAIKFGLVLTFFVEKKLGRNKIIARANLRVLAIFEQLV